MATSHMPGKDTDNADAVTGWIIVTVLAISGFLGCGVVFYKFMTGLQ